MSNLLRIGVAGLLYFMSEAANQAYSIVVRERMSFNEMFQLLQEALCGQAADFRQQTAVYRQFRSGGPGHSPADTSNALKLLTYSPKRRASQGLPMDLGWCWSSAATPAHRCGYTLERWRSALHPTEKPDAIAPFLAVVNFPGQSEWPHPRTGKS